MKRLRVWLLLLLAVLLPMRVALAAAMLCPPAGVGAADAPVVPGQGVGHHVMLDETTHAGSHDHAAHAHEAGTHEGDDEVASAHDACNLCSAFCSMAPLMSSAPALPLPQDLACSRLPDVSARAPSFLSDGQERPPRSI